MIKTFKDKETEKVFQGRFSKRIPQAIQRIAERKLIMLHRSVTLQDLRVPPANRLEALKGERTGQHSIRIIQSKGRTLRASPVGLHSETDVKCSVRDFQSDNPRLVIWTYPNRKVVQCGGPPRLPQRSLQWRREKRHLRRYGSWRPRLTQQDQGTDGQE